MLFRSLERFLLCNSALNTLATGFSVPSQTCTSVSSTERDHLALPSCSVAWRHSSGNCRVHLISFPFLRDHCSGIPDIPYLKAVSYSVCFLSHFMWGVILVRAIPCWPEVEVPGFLLFCKLQCILQQPFPFRICGVLDCVPQKQSLRWEFL